MLTKIMIALAIIFVTATGSLAVTKKPNSSFDGYETRGYGRDCCRSGDAWDRLRERNRFPDLCLGLCAGWIQRIQ